VTAPGLLDGRLESEKRAPGGGIMLEPLGIIASESCREPRQDAKQWFHLVRFTFTYCELLSRYRIVAPDSTASMLRNYLSGMQDTAASRLRENIEPVGGAFRGIVNLAARVARGELRRILVFQDPLDLSIERPEQYALLRNCNLAGAYLCFNATAHLWALYECHRLRIPQKWEYIYTPEEVDGVRETVAFIAHDGQKERIARFAIRYHDVLREFPRLMATSGTRDYIIDRFKSWLPGETALEIEVAGETDETDKASHGPSGGDVVIADEIFYTYSHFEASTARHDLYAFWNVLFFVDHKATHPHEPDIQVLLKTCVNPLHKVNLILNSRMAAEWAARYREKAKAVRLRTRSRGRMLKEP